MDSKDLSWIANLVEAPNHEPLEFAMISKKRSLSDIEEDGRTHSTLLFDDASYRKKVLLLSSDQSENDYDLKLTKEAKEYGLLPKDVATTPGSLDSLAASLSLTTIASDPRNLSSTHSRISQSTMPTSCGSSEQRPNTQASYATGNLPSPATTPSVHSTSEKKTRFGLKGGLRRLSGMTKRKSENGVPLELMTINSAGSTQSGTGIEKNRSRISLVGSFKSRTSSKTHHTHAEEAPVVYDEEAVHRSRTNAGLKALRQTQSEAAARFVKFEAKAYASQKKQHEEEILSLDQLHADLLREKGEEVLFHPNPSSKMSLTPPQIRSAEEQLEERQLKAEEDLRRDLDEQKRRAVTRLRHMEAYCNEADRPNANSPLPSSRKNHLSAGPSTRKVTKSDYDSLSQQYHLIATMDTLHESKINVLRGTQEQRTMALMIKNENALSNLFDDCRVEKVEVEKRQQGEEGRLVSIFVGKKCRMCMRWRLGEEIERKKLEKETGLLFGPLPGLTFPELPLGEESVSLTVVEERPRSTGMVNSTSAILNANGQAS
jgi:hypothetical protein